MQSSTNLALLVSLLAAPSFAQPEETPSEKSESPNIAVDKSRYGFDMSLGFMATSLNSSALPLVFKSGDAVDLPGASGLTAPFGGPTATAITLTGPQWEVRSVHQWLRFTGGLQKSFSHFRQGSMDGESVAGGSPLVGPPLRVSPRSLSLWSIRLGLGAEHPFGRVTPFLDAVGDIQLASADVVVEGKRANYTSSGFALAVRRRAHSCRQVTLRGGCWRIRSARCSALRRKSGGRVVLRFQLTIPQVESAQVSTAPK